MAKRVQQMLCELAHADAPVIGVEEADRRIKAINLMFDAGDGLNTRQFQEVMTTAHFATYFGDALSRMFYADYQYQGSQWRNFVVMDEVPDFRDVDRYRGDEPGGLYRRREKQTVGATEIGITKLSYGVEEYARQFDVSWQAILNDDMGKIRETPMKMLRAANRWLDTWVTGLYDNATTQAALNALGALYRGTGRLTHANLTTAVNAFLQRTDAQGNLMVVDGLYLVIPPILEIQAAVILESLLQSGVATNDKNVLGRYIRGVYTDPYITTAAPNVPWYLIAVPSAIPTITVARLRGMPGPVVMKKRSDIEMIYGSAPGQMMAGSFATGDLEYQVVDIVGGWDDATWVGVTDFHGIYYSSGTTA